MFISINKSKSDAIAVLVLASVVLVLVTAFRPLELIRDSAGWAQIVQAGDLRQMLHPHHLLYMPINWIVLKAASTVCSSCDAVNAGQLHGAFWAIVLAISSYFLVRVFLTSRVACVLFALLILLSQSIWILALQPQAYVPTLGVLTLLLATLFWARSAPPSGRRTTALVLLYSLLVLYHQMMALISLPLAYYFVATQGRTGLKVALKVIGGAGIAAISAYAIATYIVVGELSIGNFWRFATLFHQVMADPTYFSIGNVSLTNIGVLVHSQLGTIVTPPWRLGYATYVGFSLIVVVTLGWNVYAIVRRSDYYQERSFALISLALVSLCLLWGNPLDDAWPTFNLVFLTILWAAGLRDLLMYFRRSNHVAHLAYGLLGLAVASVAAKNFVDRILPMHLDLGKDYFAAKDIHDAIPQECFIPHVRQHVFYNLPYYFSRESADFWDVVTFFYYRGDGPLPLGWDAFSFSRTKCVAIDVRFIDPMMSVASKSGFDLPNRYRRLMQWLFEVDLHDGNQYSWRKYSLVQTGRGEVYVVIYPAQRETAQADFFTSLSARLAESKPYVADHFLLWRVQNSELVSVSPRTPTSGQTER